MTPRSTCARPWAVLLLLALVLLPVYVELTGSRFLLTLFTRIVILALARGQPESDPWLWRHDELRPRRLSRHRRLCRRHSGAFEGVTTGFVQWPVALVVSALFALGDRRAQPAHTRRLFHHDHFGVSRRWLTTSSPGLARYGGDDGLTIQKRSQFIAPINLLEQGAVLLHLSGAAVRCDLSGRGGSSTRASAW